MYSKFVTEPADRECDDMWAGHYVMAPMRDQNSLEEREGDTEKNRERDREDNIHTRGKREGGREQKHRHVCSIATKDYNIQ